MIGDTSTEPIPLSLKLTASEAENRLIASRHTFLCFLAGL